MSKPKVFISWSGALSGSIAGKVNDWLPRVLPGAESWLSKDLPKGAQWPYELNKKLGETGFGLFIVTRENIEAPWMMYEAGAISGARPEQRCCPLLFGLEPNEVQWPMSQFQFTKFSDREDVLRLVTQMNAAMGQDAHKPRLIETWFADAWTGFEEEVVALLSSNAKQPRTRADREILEEILEITRALAADANLTKNSARALSAAISSVRRDSEIDRLKAMMETLRDHIRNSLETKGEQPSES